jgi:dTDP-4-dehydrorhamnose 3,5-epimerase-like enzyme
MKKTSFFEIASLKSRGRYWFQKKYTDIRRGKRRSVLVALEKSYKSINEWMIRIQDRDSRQTWRLMSMYTSGEKKLMFERVSHGLSGVKSEILPLSVSPDWLIRVLKLVRGDLRAKSMDGNASVFLYRLIAQITAEKTDAIKNSSAKLLKTKLPGLFHIVSTVHGDARGSFREVVRVPEVTSLTGYDFLGAQVNHSHSTYGTLRGLHVEPWAKLVTVVSGLALCVILDCRPRSRTFGKYEMIYLGYGKNDKGEEIKGGALFVEPGLANSYMVLSKKCDYAYVVDDLWTPQTSTYAINPMDPKLAIPWDKFVPLSKIIRSDRDINSPDLEAYRLKVG